MLCVPPLISLTSLQKVISMPEEKYAALTTTSIHHEGDERSRTNPGHGYPAYTENVATFTKFKNEEDMKQWILRRSRFETYTIIKYVELVIETEVTVKVK